MAARNRTWLHDELILALDLYLRHAGNPLPKGRAEITELSETLNGYLGIATEDRFRNINGGYMKLMSFRRFDPVFTEARKRGLPRGGQKSEMSSRLTQPARIRRTEDKRNPSGE